MECVVCKRHVTRDMVVAVDGSTYCGRDAAVATAVSAMDEYDGVFRRLADGPDSGELASEHESASTEDGGSTPPRSKSPGDE